MRCFVFFLSIIFSYGKMLAQDTIITMNNESIIAKVTEISPREVKYKKYDYLDGPTYIQNKSDLKMIRYANGRSEIFISGNTNTLKKEEKTVINVTEETDYYGGPGSSTSPVSANKLTARGSRYSYQNKFISEKKLHLMLNDTKDRSLMALVGKAKDNKKLQYIGFGAFPLGIASIVAFSSAFTYYPNSSTIKSVNQSYINLSGVLVAAAISCPVIAIVAKSKRTKYNKEAVKLYNQKF